MIQLKPQHFLQLPIVISGGVITPNAYAKICGRPTSHPTEHNYLFKDQVQQRLPQSTKAQPLRTPSNTLGHPTQNRPQPHVLEHPGTSAQGARKHGASWAFLLVCRPVKLPPVQSKMGDYHVNSLEPEHLRLFPPWAKSWNCILFA